MALEEEARLLHAATRARLVDHDKGTAALLVYSQLRNLGAAFSFGQFLVERGLLSQMALEGLERNLASGSDVPARTISRLGDFELLELLGEGQTGSVFRARQVSLERPVAIKVLSPRLASDPEALERFLNEARVCARLKHPHIIQFYRLAKCEGLYYIAMELAPGGSLRKLLAKQGRLEEQHALTLSREVAAALAAAHQAGLLHRDVKPENILLDEAGQAKLADLGIAVRTAEGAGGEGSGEFWGTPDYLAPEVITGEAPDDARSDLYSLGATLFEVLAGAPPFPAKSPQETLRHQVRTPPPDLRGARADLLPQTVTLVMRLLAKDPAARFPDAQSLVEAFDVVLGLLAAASPAARPARMAAQRRTPAAGRLTPAAGRGTPSGRERAIPRRPGLGGGPQPGPGGRPRPGTGPQDGPQRRPYRR